MEVAPLGLEPGNWAPESVLSTNTLQGSPQHFRSRGPAGREQMQDLLGPGKDGRITQPHRDQYPQHTPALWEVREQKQPISSLGPP